MLRSGLPHLVLLSFFCPVGTLACRTRPPKGAWTYASGTRASATQLPWERDPHKAPKLGIPPGAVSPAMCRRLSGHAILCSQGKWGRGGQPSTLFPGTSLPSPGVRRTFHNPGNVRVLEVKIFYFFSYNPPIDDRLTRDLLLFALLSLLPR